MAVLNEDAVYAIKRLLGLKTWEQAQIARWFGVCISAVHNIKQGKTWRHVP
jgi:hypothetical protein